MGIVYRGERKDNGTYPLPYSETTLPRSQKGRKGYTHQSRGVAVSFFSWYTSHMSEFIYSQRFSAYKDRPIGWYLDHKGHTITLTMGGEGCAITCFAMLLSYFNKKAFYPDQMLSWLEANKGITRDGRVYWEALCRAAGGKLRLDTKPAKREGENFCIGIRMMHFGNGHFIMDNPNQIGMMNNPWTGKIENFSEYEQKYPATGYNFFYLGTH